MIRLRLCHSDHALPTYEGRAGNTASIGDGPAAALGRLLFYVATISQFSADGTGIRDW
jgi:hypothetical protein